MFVEALADTVTATIDSHQMVAAGVTLQVTAVTKSDSQTITNETYTVVSPRHTLNEQKPFVFSIVGSAVVYVAAFVTGRIIKMQMPHRSQKKRLRPTKNKSPRRSLIPMTYPPQTPLGKMENMSHYQLN